MGKDGEPFTTTTFNYTIKDNLTGEITHAYISRSKVLSTTLYQRDLIILEKKNKPTKYMSAYILKILCIIFIFIFYYFKSRSIAVMSSALVIFA